LLDSKTCWFTKRNTLVHCLS